MPRSIYAVKAGRHTGLFSTWAEAKAEVLGYKNAQYKKFKIGEKNIAESYLAGGSPDAPHVISPMTARELVAYVDGSYNEADNRIGSGLVLIAKRGRRKIHAEINARRVTAKYGQHLCNVTGELHAAMMAAAFARKYGFKTLTIAHDYQGISAWAEGAWQAKNGATRAYAAFMADANKSVAVTFVKIAAHTGVKENEEADRLARTAAGIQ